MEYTTIGLDSPNPLKIPRIITGLWQLAGGHDAQVNLDEAVEVMHQLVEAGLRAFDMADHYGPAEEVIGKYHQTYRNSSITAFTKWCPKPGPTSPQIIGDAIHLALTRLNQPQIDILQFHIWEYHDRFYPHNIYYLSTLQDSGQIKHLGLTNTDLAHLKLLEDTGIKISTNQVSCSLLDRRVKSGGMGEWCLQKGVGILAYGVLLGGFMSEKWLDREEPTEKELENWSLRKYKRFIDAAGGWEVFQILLKAVDSIAKKHSVPISTIAIRHVLDIPGVSAVIIGSRLTLSSVKYIPQTLQALQIQLDQDDKDMILKAQAGLEDIPGDCGDEYRRPPFLTAAGDLNDHLSDGASRKKVVEEAIGQGRRVEYSSGSIWEPIAGYCRAVRIGNTITISGTTATSLPDGRTIGGESPESQTTHIFDIINAALISLGGTLKDVVRTRTFLRNVKDCEEVVKVHGRVFGREGVRPGNTTLGDARLVGEELLLEVEADAIVGCKEEVLRL